MDRGSLSIWIEIPFKITHFGSKFLDKKSSNALTDQTFYLLRMHKLQLSTFERALHDRIQEPLEVVLAGPCRHQEIGQDAPLPCVFRRRCPSPNS